MPTANDPEKKPQPVKPAAKPAAAKPAAAKTVATAAAAAPTKPGVATKPATPPKPASKSVPLAKPAQRPAAEEADEEQGPSLGTSLLKQTPAWAVSMLVHIVALLAMALIVSEPPKKEVSVSIVSSTAEDEENFEEFEEEMPEETPVDPSTDPVADVAVTTDVVVENVQVVSDASDVDAAPLAVELSEFGDITAPASDMLSTIGAVGGTGGGYGGRKNAGRLAATGGGGADTESAVDKALKWLIAHQMPDGGWSFDLKACPSCQGKCSHGGTSYGKDRCAATAMALLPFFGRGYTHKDGPYKPQLEAGIAFLAGLAMAGQGNAAKAGGGNAYSQGLAGIALSEAYAMTQDNRLQMPAQYVLNFIMDSQDPVGGGWGYGPKTAGDTSIVGWQLMALKSGNMAYLEVNPATIKKAIGYLDSVEDDSGAFYGYRGPGRGGATTAVGLLCRMYLGWKKDHPALQRGVEFLAKMGPQKDLYFSYYATQIMHHMEGDVWQAWNTKMKEMLLKSQGTEGHEAGSWYKGVDGGHGAHGAGRLYCTSLATMMLEVYYRHLPIYRGQATDDEFKE
jgi:hypothetical protein